MVLLMLMSTNRRMMGAFCISKTWKVIGWTATAVMGAATVALMVATASG
jgi:Mn2+/Fe2+ NRAMP family transporter